MSAEQARESARLHAIVEGFVQGVSFRYYTQQQAEGLGVAGWVRNRRDGSVEVMAEGNREALQRLVDFLKVGPPSAKVTELKLEWQAPTGEFNAFDVRY